MSQDEVAKTTRIKEEKALELLFNDSCKNVSDLKSRQWTASNYGVLAIMAIAAFAHANPKDVSPCLVLVIMLLIVTCHEVVTIKCHTNLGIFRRRIKTLVKCHFAVECHQLFMTSEEEKRKWLRRWAKAKEEPDFETAVVDEGRIEFMLFATTPVTFGLACCLVFPNWGSFRVAVAQLLAFCQ